MKKKNQNWNWKFATEFAVEKSIYGNKYNSEFEEKIKSGKYKCAKFSLLPQSIKEQISLEKKVNGNRKIIFKVR